MSQGDVAVRLERRIAAPPAILWALVADSNRVDRMLGAGRVGYHFEPGADDRLRVGSGRVVGVDSTWVEHGEWIEGVFLIAERRYMTGLLTRAGFRVDLDAAEGGALLRMHAWMIPRAAPPGGLAVLEATTRAGIERYVDSVAKLLEGASARAANDSDAPAALRARQLLAEIEAGADASAAAAALATVAGKTSPTNETHWQFCVARFAAAPVEARVRERLLDHLRARADEELRQIRPFELARAWHEAPRVVLGAFLHAARAGLVDLRWELICPSCRVASAISDSLGTVQRDAHCDECEIVFDLDFARNVEAVFRINASIRAVDARLYCGGSPWWRPHVFARFEVPAAETRRAHTELPHELVVRSQRPRAVAAVDGRRGVHVVVDAAGLRARPGDGGVSIENHTDREVAVTVERAQLDAAAVLGTDVMTMSEFHDLFATEAPATGVDLTIGSLTVLFSDLTDTTSLYERLGDARAFALIEDHFKRMTQVVRAHDGAVVKTMGDAIMASFASPAHALTAALRMVAETHEMHGDRQLELKVGLHAGPCLAVRANDQLDFFGSTVNLAARLQTQARGGEVAILDELLEHPGVAEVVQHHGVTIARQRVVLKGLRDERKIAIVRGALGAPRA